jgi:uncharacterized protein (DUF924 family)
MTERSDELPAEAAALIDYWFSVLDEETWWRPTPAIDSDIHKRFFHLYEHIVRDGLPRGWLASPKGRLAAIIALDQLPRNLHRGDARAFASDDLALALAKRAIEAGDEKALDKRQRIFLYLPFEHCEDAGAQARSVELYAALGDEQCLEFAKMHQDVIERFGRFPHRNEPLGRETTPEEADFLKGEALFW